MKYSKYNVVIIGSGISGLYLANKLSVNSNFSDGILLVTKEELFSGSSALAQGGIVSVIPELNPLDSIESHVKDTIKAGCGLNNLDIVEFVSKNSSVVADELSRFGIEFDKNSNNIWNFTLEGAHSCPRILHSKGDSTGRVIEEELVKQVSSKENIDIYTNTMALELLVGSDNSCHGVVVCNWKTCEYETIYSNNIILATGGIGQIYSRTTNPAVSTGDGIALAYNAGAKVENMEFVQFHPTALYCKDKESMPLVSESVRGEGAKLVDLDSNYFAKDYHALADLAPRDVVARAIKQHTRNKNHKFVNLDISSIGLENFKKRFPTITKLCEENNTDIASNLIPVMPAEHYFMGGIKVNSNSQTTIQNLYALGECSSTGLHGANRLASNSLLECGVFARELALKLLKDDVKPPKKHDLKINNIVKKYLDKDFSSSNSFEQITLLMKKLKENMTQYAGITRNKDGLNTLLMELAQIEREFNELDYIPSRKSYELSFALCVSKLIAKSALNNETSIGAHFRDDCQKIILNKNEQKEEIKNELLSK